MKSDKLTLNFGNNILSKISMNTIKEKLKFLVEIFKKDEYVKYFPTKIQHDVDFLYLAHLSQALERLKNCNGFEEHIKEFKNSVESTYFVTSMSDYLLSNSLKLELEPNSDGMNKKADILAEINGQEIYFECKNPKNDILTSVCKEHEAMYEELYSSITKPCDVTITHQQTLKNEQIRDLGVFLKKKLLLVTDEGEVLNYKGVKVEVTRVRENFVNNGDSVVFCNFWDNYHDNALYPGTIINKNGVAMSFFKTENDLKNLEYQVNNSKNKAPEDKPFIIAVNGDFIPGKLSDINKFANKLFNENKNTSINGILLVRFEYRYTFERYIGFRFNYINNPFARNKVPKLSQIFKSTF